ncbi:MAG: hypothetical protein C4560_11750 [Nitrospiraceae bacterium]|nr:MAG: hypothetical protein C4560_11750 [Nitrospiraceae bacterium]
MQNTKDIDSEIQELIDAIYMRYGYDLSGYARSFIKRRVLRRLSLSKIISIGEMKKKLLVDESFCDTLLLDISISVTEMFRDPGFYSMLRKAVFPYLRTYPFLRIWVAGCATGEEVFSLAVLLKEEGLYGKSRIYATDSNNAVLQKAKAGIFPIRNLKKYTYNYQKAGGVESFSDYYTADSGYAIMDRSLMENIVFSGHNLVTDGVFNEMNLISCRNVLIYFNRALQDRVVRLFSGSLCHNGFLCLGSKESLRISNREDAFEVFAEEKIYRKKHDMPNIPGEMDHEGEEPSLSNNNILLKNTPYEAIVIGSSAGGMRALTAILSSLAAGFTLPVIIVQHQQQSDYNYLAHLLNEKCPLTVKDAEEKESIRPGTVYIAPPGYHLMIENDRTFSLSMFEPVNFARPSIDVLFESAADVYGEKLIGIILTGANDDGSRGLKRVKELGGLAIVQDPATAEASSMPKAAIEATGVDQILPFERIGGFLSDMVLCRQTIGSDL